MHIIGSLLVLYVLRKGFDWVVLMPHFLRFLDPISMCVGGFPAPISNSAAPSGCLRIQLNPDTIYPDSISFRRLRAQSHKTASHKPGLLPVLLADQL